MRHSVTILFLFVSCLLVSIARAQAPIPAFSASTVEGCTPVVVTFSDQSAGSPTSWFWDFGNGATSTLKNPSTTYFIPGTYTVTLKVTNASGTQTLSRSNYITVYGKPTINFTVGDSTGCYPFPVQFTDLSTASAGTQNVAWVWDFGDGTQSTVQNPLHQYTSDGNYTVLVKVTNDKGCWNVAAKVEYIKIAGGITADFNFVKPPGCAAPFTVPFTNASTGVGNLSYVWKFGDGDSSIAINPTHDYAVSSLYNVTLVASSSEGCTATVTKEVSLTVEGAVTSFQSADGVCQDAPIVFSNTSSPGASSVLWDFGDGTTSTSINPDAKVYSSAGTFTVTLTQTFGSCTTVYKKDVVINPKPVAGFGAAETVQCKLPFTVSFQNSSTGSTTNQWIFGDSVTVTGPANPAHTYGNYGSYDVTLITTSAAGCTDTLVKPAFIQIRKPVIKFTSLPIGACIPYTAQLSVTVDSPDPVVSYAWDLGNGLTSTAATPSFTFNTVGTYPVTLSIVTASGCTDTLRLDNAIAVGRKPTAAFVAAPLDVCASQMVQFTSTTTDAFSFDWYFGDGGRSTEQNPLYEFSDTGTFSVRLIVGNSGCTDTADMVNYITVRPPIARFEFQQDCSKDLEIGFKDQSLGATTWQWNFGDGTTSTEINPVHTFPNYGTYMVQLTVTNDTCSFTKITEVRVGKSKPDFTVSTPVACKGQYITFAATSDNGAGIASYSWNFGDGEPPSTNSMTDKFFPLANTYDVTLTVTDVNGCVDSVTKPAVVRVDGPTARINASNTVGCKGLTATFTDASVTDGRNNISNWVWNFGDSTVLQTQNGSPVQHTYLAAGDYDVSLKVTDASGCSDSVLIASLVKASEIKADFISADTLNCPGGNVRFNNLSVTPNSYTSSWIFSNGATSSQASPILQFAADGTYSATLIIRDAAGCIDSLTKRDYISVNHPVASFAVSDSNSSCIPLEVQFTNNSTYFTSFVWTLNGGTNLLPNPTQFYNFPGFFQTKLVVTSPGGCTDTATKTISVYGADASSISYVPIDGCKPLLVSIKANTPTPTDFVWDFGDGVIENNTDTAVVHEYNFFGDFVPKLILQGKDGCIVPITGPDTIRIKGVTAMFAPSQQFFCDSGTVLFIDSTTFNTPIKAYNWNFGDGTTSSLPQPSHLYSRPGIYQVSLNVVTQTNCVDTFRLTTPVKVVASPAIAIAGDSVICAGESILHAGLFQRQDTSTVQWAWQFPNGQTSGVQLPVKQTYTDPGTFVVQTVARNTDGCSDTAFQKIYVNPIPTVTLPETITTFIGIPVQIPALYSDTMKTYQWSVPTGLSCTDCPRPIALPRFDTKYTVSFTDNNGCSNTGEVSVIVLCSGDQIFIPNTFSPNGDGSNDVFYVRGKGLSRVKTLRIFNRWGQVVFERVNFAVNDPSMGWNGTFNGSKAVPGVYVYQVEIFCDNSQVKKLEGNVAVIQ